MLVLDEPTAALGVSATAAVVRLIREARGRGAGVLIVTHDPVQAAAIADEVVVFAGGRVAHAGDAGALSADHLRELMGGRE